MNSFDEVVERLTERLKGDPELRAEVGHELRGHLEESAKAFVAAGRGEEEAREEAVRAMGDKKEIADALWEGNRRRVVNRRVARWVVGGTLVPAAGVMAVSLAWGAAVSLAVLVATLAYMGTYPMGEGMREMAVKVERRVRETQLAGLTEGARRLFLAHDGSREEQVAAARGLAMERPGDRVFWAHYAAVMVEAGAWETRGTTGVVRQEKLEALLGVLAEGERLEPGNGFYPMARAAVLMSAGTLAGGWKNPLAVDVKFAPMFAKERSVRVGRWEVSDRGRYEQGLAALVEAGGRPYVRSYVTEFEEARLGVLPGATRLGDEVWRAVAEERRSASGLVFGKMLEETWMAGTEVVWLAREGKMAEAGRIVGAERAVARMAARDARQGFESNWGMLTYDQALAQWAAACAVAGEREGRERAVGRLIEFEKAFGWGRATSDTEEAQKRAGWMDGYFIGHLTDPRKMDVRPEREAEYAVLDQVGAAWWAMLLAGVAGWHGLVAVGRRVRVGRWPGVMLVGWRRLAGVIGVGMGVPLAAYVGYAYWLGVGRGWGVGVSTDRLMVEYATVGAVMAALLRLAWERAMQRRGREIGVVDRPAEDWWRVRAWVGAGLGVMVFGYLAYWAGRVEGMRAVGSPTNGWGLVLAAVLAGYAASWLMDGGRRWTAWVGPAVVAAVVGMMVFTVRWDFSYLVMREISASVMAAVMLVGLAGLGAAALGAGRRAENEGAFGRGLSMTPVLLVAAVVLAGVGGGAARAKERRAVSDMARTGAAVRFDHEAEGRGDRTGVKLMEAWRSEEAEGVRSI